MDFFDPATWFSPPTWRVIGLSMAFLGGIILLAEPMNTWGFPFEFKDGKLKWKK